VRLDLDSPDATLAAGERLGRAVAAGDLIGMIGDLGAGKTLLVQGIARGLAVPAEARVTSPTFTLVNEYRGGRLALAHADLYRIEKARELEEIGLDEIGRRGAGLLVVEWSDRFPVLGADRLDIRMEVTGPQSRVLTATATGPRGAALLARWQDQK
jgi:tRNA threonylcarbamoyladenosine biosynthesis protein TsaE